MADKKCMIFETTNSIGDFKIQECSNPKEMRLQGIFGCTGVTNRNSRRYSKENYGVMVEALQKTIAETGCMGELEHPNSMNIDLNNVSHKIESIHMNEDGTVTGTILLLNTPKGQIAKAIVEGGLPLYISSRGAGTIDAAGNVTLQTLKTYDLVGDAGFSQAKLGLAKNQTFECLNESLEDGPVAWAIVEGSDEDPKDGEDNKKNDDAPKDDTSKKEDAPKDDKSSDDKPSDDDADSKKDDKPKKKLVTAKAKDSDDGAGDDDDDKNNTDNVDMNELKEAIDRLTDKVNTLEAELHIAKESLKELKRDDTLDVVESWVKDEYGPKLRAEMTKEIAKITEEWTSTEFATGMEEWIKERVTPAMEKWCADEFAVLLENWCKTEFADAVEGWNKEEFAKVAEGWISSEFAPQLESWINNDVMSNVERWVNEEYTGTLQQWVKEHLIPERDKSISAFIESQKTDKYETIDKMLEALESEPVKGAEAVLESVPKDRFSGIYCIDHMPAELRPAWTMLSEARKEEIARSSKMYDFSKTGVLESFWAGVDMNESAAPAAPETKVQNFTESYMSQIARQALGMRH